MIINREPEPAHWRRYGGGGAQPPGWRYRAVTALTIAAASFAVASFAFDWWVARSVSLAPDGPARGVYRYADLALSLALWVAGGVALLGLMSDRRCLVWSRTFVWPVLRRGAARPRWITLARHVAVITLLCLVVYAVEVVQLKWLLAGHGAQIEAFQACAGGYECAQDYRAYLTALSDPIRGFLWGHAAAFAALGVAIVWRARRARSVAEMVFSTPHGIFLFHRLDAYAVVLLAQATLLCALTLNIERALALHAPTLMASADSGLPTLTAMFGGLGDNPLLTGVFASGLIFSLGAYATGFVRLASPYHSLLEAQRVIARDRS